jgi:hypothetical protein
MLFIYLKLQIIFSLKAAGPRSCNGAACASLQQYGFAIAVISTALKPNRRRRLTHELVKPVQYLACFTWPEAIIAIYLKKRN